MRKSDILTVLVLNLFFLLSPSADGKETEVGKKQVLTEAGINIRATWDGYWKGSEFDRTNSGFRGSMALLRMAGDISEHFSFYTRLRLSASSFIYGRPDANTYIPWIDKAFVTYHTGIWAINAGKQNPAMGGFDFALNPMDTYFTSDFVKNISSYLWGVSASATFGDGSDIIAASFTQSELRTLAAPNLYAGHVEWEGKHGFYSSLFSAGISGVTTGGITTTVLLGNKFSIPGGVTVIFDLTHRGNDGAVFFKDFTLNGELSWADGNHKVNVFAKCFWDYCDANATKFAGVLPGTSVVKYGGGIEYFPLPSSRVIRLHAVCCHESGYRNFQKSNATTLLVGISWNPEFIRK